MNIQLIGDMFVILIKNLNCASLIWENRSYWNHPKTCFLSVIMNWEIFSSLIWENQSYRNDPKTCFLYVIMNWATNWERSWKFVFLFWQYLVNIDLVFYTSFSIYLPLICFSIRIYFWAYLLSFMYLLHKRKICITKIML